MIIDLVLFVTNMWCCDASETWNHVNSVLNPLWSYYCIKTCVEECEIQNNVFCRQKHHKTIVKLNFVTILQGGPKKTLQRFKIMVKSLECFFSGHPV